MHSPIFVATLFSAVVIRSHADAAFQSTNPVFDLKGSRSKTNSLFIANSDAPNPLPYPETSFTPSNAASGRREDLQKRLQFETLSRIALPSTALAALCYLIFPSVTSTLFVAIRDAFDGVNTGYGAETLNLILTDNSNQFIQNVHNALALIFTFLTAFTFAFVYRQQETLYYALFEELSAVTSLLEQIALVAEGRPQLYKTLLQAVGRYIDQDLKVVTDYSFLLDEKDNSSPLSAFSLTERQSAREELPALLLSSRPIDDPLETILFVTSVGEPSYIYSTVKELRQARAKRLASLQRKVPEINMYLLYSLGFTTWISFPVVATGSYTVGGDALLDVFRVELSFGVFAMSLVLGIINELKRPEVGGAYNIDYSVLGRLVDGIEGELDRRLEKADTDLKTLEIETHLKSGSSDSNKRTMGKKRIVRRILDKISFRRIKN
jgi:hypothetical protein